MEQINEKSVPSKASSKSADGTALSAAELTSLLQYPTFVPGPSRRNIQKLYDEALENLEDGDQQMLQPVGILSFQDVMLPALALEEDRALKQMQKKVQRDAPQLKRVMQECRCHVYKAVEAARQAAKESRIQRETAYREKLQREHDHKMEMMRAQREQDRQTKLAAQQLRRNQALRKQQRQHPKNQELWREIIFLLTAVSQLEKEEKLWKAIDSELEQQQKARANEAKDNEDAEEVENDMTAEVPLHPLQERVESSVTSISLSSTRIQDGLQTVLSMINEADQLRRDLYAFYTKDFQFQGYLGIKNPKSMIQFLSQTQEEDYGGDSEMDNSNDDDDNQKETRMIDGNTVELTPKTLIRRFLFLSQDE